MPWNFLGHKQISHFTFLRTLQPEMRFAKKRAHTENLSSSFATSRCVTTKTGETEKFNYKHSINPLNALLRLRHHSHLWHFIYKTLSEKHDKYAFCISHFSKHMEWRIFSVFSCRAHEMSGKKKVKSQNTLTNFFSFMLYFHLNRLCSARIQTNFSNILANFVILSCVLLNVKQFFLLSLSSFPYDLAE